ncbi:ABC transporter permease [Candidatus Peregrinibacteria bacterium]|nr:ABC transporter permease [Candidatus Peregrinibacteria bacterium]
MAAKSPKVKDLNGNIITSFFRGLKLGLMNFWRNKFLSMATIIVMAVILFIFNIILAVQYISNQALQSLSEHVDIVIDLHDDVDYFSAQKLTVALEQIPGVKEVQFTSKEEALEIASKTHPEIAEQIEKFNIPNPLPPSISVTTTNPEDQEAVKALLRNDEYRTLLRTNEIEGSSGEDLILSSVARNLQNIGTFVRQIIFWIVLVFILGGTLIIVNAIQITIYSRRQEIHIMRLVGATPGFIRLPYVFEAFLYALFAVGLSFVILGTISQSIELDGTNLWDYYSNLNLSRVFVTELSITMVLAIVSSFSATEQYIKGKLNLN